MNKFYITTAIDYVNGKPHVGHAVEKIQADVLARYNRLNNNETYFIGGTDENSLKSVHKAEEEGLPVEEYIKKYSESFVSLKESLDISYDDFIKTSQDKRNAEGAQKLWKLCDKDLYKKKYKGLYCVGCEEYKKEEDLIDGKCPDHNKAPDEIEEENYFFKLSGYQDKLRELISTDKIKILPEHRKNEVLGFIDQGLEDFSVSRSKERAKGWGVSVLGDKNEVMYVWFDALSSYINVLNYADEGELYKKYWDSEDSERVHVIGKGILRFHAVYWPAMLLSSGLPLPTEIYVHEYLTINNKKISKTLGNVINPDEVVEKYGKDAARYLLLSALPYQSDGDVSWEKMDEKYKADLVNGLGNVLSRATTLCKGSVPVVDTTRDTTQIGFFEFDEVVRWKTYDDHMTNRNTFAILDKVLLKNVKKLNEFLESYEPWKKLKGSDEEVKLAKMVLYYCLEDLRHMSLMLKPIMPLTSDKIMKALGLEPITKITEEDKKWGKLVPGTKLGEKVHLFERL